MVIPPPDPAGSAAAKELRITPGYTGVVTEAGPGQPARKRGDAHLSVGAADANVSSTGWPPGQAACRSYSGQAEVRLRGEGRY
jgi:hypothetical protein